MSERKTFFVQLFFRTCLKFLIALFVIDIYMLPPAEIRPLVQRLVVRHVLILEVHQLLEIIVLLLFNILFYEVLVPSRGL